MKQLYLIFFFISAIHLYAQESRTTAVGEIKSDSLPTDNVHVINISSKRGTISNSTGNFQISIRVNDTLEFSNIQFNKKSVVIRQAHIDNRYIEVILFEKTNDLQEVVIKQSRNMAKSLGLPNAGKKPLNKLERNLNHYSQKSTPIVILQALLFKPGGIDDVYNIVSGNRKRDRKLKALIDQDRQLEIDLENIQKIRDHFEDEFFIKTIKIPKEDIDSFIDYCLTEELLFSLNDERYIELIDAFVSKKEEYLNLSKKTASILNDTIR